MANYRITAFDGVNFTAAGMYTKSGTAGYTEARFKPLHPPHSAPLDPYGGNSAPIKYKPIKTNLLFVGDPDDVQTNVALVEAKLGESGTLTGYAGSGTKTLTAYMTNIEGNWEAPFKDGETQWLSLTVTFQPTTAWA